MAIIIAGFAGIGKSELLNMKQFNHLKINDSIDFKFSWKFNQNQDIVKNKEFPNNYIEYILDEAERYDIILTSTESIILDAIIQSTQCNIVFGKPYLVYPMPDEKDTYIKRYEKYKSGSDFIEYMAWSWDILIDELEYKDGCNRYILSEGEYLSDMIENSLLKSNTLFK